MLLPLELLKLRRLAKQAFVPLIIHARHLLAEISVGEAYSKLLRVEEASAKYLDDGATRRWAAFGLDSVDTDRCIEDY